MRKITKYFLLSALLPVLVAAKEGKTVESAMLRYNEIEKSLDGKISQEEAHFNAQLFLWDYCKTETRDGRLSARDLVEQLIPTLDLHVNHKNSTVAAASGCLAYFLAFNKGYNIEAAYELLRAYDRKIDNKYVSTRTKLIYAAKLNSMVEIAIANLYGRVGREGKRQQSWGAGEDPSSLEVFLRVPKDQGLLQQYLELSRGPGREIKKK
ncbi:hypothetical protein GW915_07865 [bacterium]|nr:hypothetical protein [bacterium]